jgi:hypothetical protein
MGLPTYRPKLKTGMVEMIAGARAILAQVVAADLPALEEAIETGDLELARNRAEIVRAARLRVRGLLGSGAGEIANGLRADWAKVASRIDFVLLAAPRPDNLREVRMAMTVTRALADEVYFAPAAAVVDESTDEPTVIGPAPRGSR